MVRSSGNEPSEDHDLTQYRLIFERCPVGIALVGADGYALRSNAALERMLGYSEAELQRMRFRDFTHVDDVAADEALFRELVEGVRADYQFEKRYIRKSGEIFWSRLTVYRLAWDPLQIVSIVEDTGTLRSLRDAEAKAVRRLRERVKELTGLYEVGRALQNEGLTIDEMLSATAHALPPAFQYPSQASARVWYGTQEVRTSGFPGTSYVLGTTFDTSDATVGGIEVAYLEPLPEEEEGPFLREERALIESIADGLCGAIERRCAQERLHLAMEATRAGMWEWDVRNDALLWPSGMRSIFGIDGTRVPQGLSGFLALVHSDDRSLVQREIERAITSATDEYAARFRILRPDGELRWLATHGRVLRDGAGRPRRMLGLAIDDTEQHALEERLRQTQRLEAIGGLAAGIAHDFNNLLSVVLGYSELALMGSTPDDSLRSQIEEIRRAGARGGELTRQLLAFSRQQLLQPRPVDLNQIVRGVEKMLRRLMNEDIELTLLLAPDLATMCADPGQCEQVIVNLAVNARDAMPGGGKLFIETSCVRVEVASTLELSELPAGDYIALTVRDTGVGMTEATLARIFEPFFTTKEVGQGVGLGLSTVFGIVRQGGGYIQVSSELGRGTTFQLYFPSIEGPAECFDVRPSFHPMPRGTESVLLVEDDDQVRGLAHAVLSRFGYHVIEAKSCGDALLIAEQYPAKIDLLLTDVVMPRMSGSALAQRLTSMRPDLKVLFMSGYTTLLELGVSFVQKPLTPDTLLRRVREVLAPSDPALSDSGAQGR